MSLFIFNFLFVIYFQGKFIRIDPKYLSISIPVCLGEGTEPGGAALRPRLMWCDYRVIGSSWGPQIFFSGSDMNLDFEDYLKYINMYYYSLSQFCVPK